MRKTLLSLAILLAVCAQGVLPASAQGPTIAERFRSVDKALHWLANEQNADGGFGEPTSDPETSCSVVLAFAAAYEDPDTVQDGDSSPLDFLATQVPTYTVTVEGTARTILAVVAGNYDPHGFAGTDLIATLVEDYYQEASGRYQADPSDGIAAHSLAILALQGSKESVPSAAKTWLRSQRNFADGGWGLMPGDASDTTSTALSIQALLSAGASPSSTAVLAGVNYLRARQTADAGFAASATESESDPASTAHAIQALLAAGEDLLSSEYSWCLRTPFDALVDDQSGDGSFGGDVLVTAASTPGLMGRSLPLPGRGLAAMQALEWLHTQQKDGSEEGNPEPGSFGGGAVTADAVYAIALCGEDPDGPDWTKGGTSALDALETLTPDYIVSGPPGGPAGELGKVIRAVEAAGGNPHDFAGLDLVDELIDTYNASTGRYNTNKVFSHDLALIALHAVSETIPAQAVTTLEAEQTRLGNGSWPWSWDGSTGDVDTTGISLQALVAGGGPTSPDVAEDAVGFLESLRFPDGGYPDLATRTEPNCNSTALAIEGMLAVGMYREQPLLIPLETGGVSSSWDALLAFQEPSGSFAFTASGPESRLLATLEAIQTLVSPLYPEYEPQSDVDATVAGTVHARLTCGDGLEIVAPFSDDKNNDGSASLWYRVQGESPWSTPSDMEKTGISYLLQPPLDSGAYYEIQVTYFDPDGVSGEATQNLTVYGGKACVPLVLRDYTG
jgi:hypothetical protein